MTRAVLVAISLVICFSVARALSPAEQQYLEVLYSDCDGPAWLHQSGWMNNSEACTWYGVGCDSQSKHVLSLYVFSARQTQN